MNEEAGNKIKNIVLSAIEKVYHSGIEGSSSKSAKFVEHVADDLFKEFCDNKKDDLAVKRIKEDGSGIPGEWLLDAVIKEDFKISDPEKSQSKADFPKKILWAIESESSVGIKEMAKDFAKLTVVRGENYLYLNGVNQKKYVENYIKRRIETIEDIMKEMGDRFIGKNLYYGFWPRPEASKDKWEINSWEDLGLEELKNRVRLYKLEEEKMKLIEI